MLVKSLQYLKHAIKETKNHKGNKNLETLVKMEEKFNTEPSNKVRDRAKKVRYENDIPKVMKCYSAPRVTLGGGSVTKGKK